MKRTAGRPYMLSLAACLASIALAVAARGADDVPEAVLRAEQQRIAAIAKAKAAAISVFARGGSGGGSGVVITPDGYALTNFHVAKPSGNFMKCSMPDGRMYDAVIVGLDAPGDVALIKLLGRDDFPCAEMGDSDLVRVGDWCFAVGNPFLLATDLQPTVTYGIVSGVHRFQYPAGTLLEYADCIQTDASINPGNSGGPLFNAEGQLIGINGRGSFEKRGRVNVGVGYAISINQIKHFLGCLHSGRLVDHATLGATVSSNEDGRPVVTNILESSDAYRRGLRYGDEIVSFGGRSIDTVNGFKNALGIYPKGWRVPLSFRRDGEDYEILVRLAGVHSAEELIAKVQGPAAPPDPQPMPERPDRPEEPDQPRDGDQPDDPQPDDSPRPMPPDGDRPGPRDGPRPIPRDGPRPIPRDGDRPGPRPTPRVRPGSQPQEVPEELAKLFQARTGYANFYFNELNRDRVWGAFQQGGDFSAAEGEWSIAATLTGVGDLEIVLGHEECAWRIAGGLEQIDTSGDLEGQLAPTGSGGLLLALHVWQRMLTLGPTSFGDVYYYGTAPMPDHDGLVDVLVGTHGVVETRFYFDPAIGQLVGLEMYPDVGVDPCEVYFSDYRPVGDRQLPHRMEVHYGDGLFGVLEIGEFGLGDDDAPTGGAAQPESATPTDGAADSKEAG